MPDGEFAYPGDWIMKTPTGFEIESEIEMGRNVFAQAEPDDVPDYGDRTDYPLLARITLRDAINKATPDNQVTLNQIYVVWFTYILGGWKALMSTTRPDGLYYEVTHNASNRETYVDTYSKTSNIVVDGLPNS